VIRYRDATPPGLPRLFQEVPYGRDRRRGSPVTQAGPSRLWDRVGEAHEFWQQAGRPYFDRFGITASTTEQYVWYDHPAGEHR
jgi:hypothetical protein